MKLITRSRIRHLAFAGFFPFCGSLCAQTPSLVVTPAIAGNFQSVYPKPSAPQEFVLSGSGLDSPLTVALPYEFQAFTQNGAYSNELVFGQPAGRIFSNSAGFAAWKSDGSVVSWFSLASSFPIPANEKVRSIHSSGSEFAALKKDGSVLTWHKGGTGLDLGSAAEEIQYGVKELYSCHYGFSALKNDGKVVTWGTNWMDWDSSHVPGLEIRSVVSTSLAYAAVMANGSVTAWGYAPYGGNLTVGIWDGNGNLTYDSVAHLLSSGVERVVAGWSAFAALKSDGSVVTWGDPYYGGDSSNPTGGNLTSQVREIYSNGGAFAALKSNGSVVTWGDPLRGGDSSNPMGGNLASNVTKIYPGGMAFAALKSDGSVVTWGSAESGGDSSRPTGGNLTLNVTAIHSSGGAFAALKSNGAVVTWGDPSAGGNSSVAYDIPGTGTYTYASRASSLTSNVTAIFSSGSAFAALKKDGSVVTWGSAERGGDSSVVAYENGNYTYQSVANSLSSNVTTIHGAGEAFAAIKKDGTVVVWGNSQMGGAGGPLESIGVKQAPVLPVSIQVRTAPHVPPGPVSGNMIVSNPEVGTITRGLSGEVVRPSLVTSVGTLGNFRSSPVGPSPSQSFTVNGSLIEDAVSLAASPGFTLSLDNSTFSSRLDLGNPAGRVYANDSSFAAITSNGSVVCWGTWPSGGNSSIVYADGNYLMEKDISERLASNVMAIQATSNAFAALKKDGSVVTWGYYANGGNGSMVYNGSETSSVAASLTSGVVSLFSNPSAFAALKKDGSVVTWGSVSHGGDSSSPTGGNLTTEVLRVASTKGAFAALKRDGSVVTWGNPNSGGNSTVAVYDYPTATYTHTSVADSLTSNVTEIFANDSAFAALKTDGSVVVWGMAGAGGDSTYATGGDLQSGVIEVFSNSNAFAALKSDGSVVAWGDSYFGGNSTYPTGGNLTSGVLEIVGNRGIYGFGAAFAALKADGSVVTWGSPYHGGNSSAFEPWSSIGTSMAHRLTSGVKAVYSTASAFAALKNDGSVVLWGDKSRGGDARIYYSGGGYGEMNGSLTSDVIAIDSTQSAFAAIKRDGSLVTWGWRDEGGQVGYYDFSGYLFHNNGYSFTGEVVEVIPTQTAFTAVKSDGSVFAWGSIVSGAPIYPPESIGTGTAAALPATIYVRLELDKPPGPIDGKIEVNSRWAEPHNITLSGMVLTEFQMGYELGHETGYSTAINEVSANPNAWNLYSQIQYNASRALGRADVISNPSLYNLHTADSIMDMNLGGVMIQSTGGGNATLRLQLQSTSNLGTQPFQNHGAPIEIPVQMDGTKGFLRIRALGPQ